MAFGELAHIPEPIEQLEQTQEISPEVEVSAQAQSAMEEIKAKALANLNHPDLVALAEQEHTEFQNTLAGHELESEASQAPREEFLADIKALERIQTTFASVEVPGGDTNSGIENMIDFIVQSGEDIQESIMNALSNNRARSLKRYFQDNGFINSQTYASFQQSEFGEDLPDIQNIRVVAEQDREEVGVVAEQDRDIAEQEKNAVVQEKNAVVQEQDLIEQEGISEKYKENKEIVDALHNNPGTDQGLLDATQGIRDSKNANEITELDLKAITDYFRNLSQNPEQFAHVLNTLGGPNTELFTQVEGFVLANAPDLRSSFQNYRENYAPLAPSQQTAATQVTQEMNNIPGGEDLSESYDFTTNPPERSISLGESEYRLEANLPVGDYYPATVEYTEAVQEVTPKLDSINAVLTYLDGLSDDVPFAQVVDVLVGTGGLVGYSVRQELGFDNLQQFSSVSQLKTSLTATLGSKKKELEDKLDAAKQQYEKDCKEVHEEYKNTIRETQEAQKKILVFLNQCGFDMIPKEITDMLITEINRDCMGLELGSSISLTGKIDIKNGHLGDERSDGNERFELGDKEKEGFVRLVNIITTGKSEGEGTIVQNPAESVSKSIPVVDTQVNSLLEDNGVKSMATGSWNINAMRVNIDTYKQSLGQ